MRIVMIGAGRLATNLSVALQKAGHEIAQVYSRTMASASALATLLNTEATDQAETLRTDADVYVFSIKDAALPHLIPVVCRNNIRALFVHTAGSMPMSIFEGHAERYGVFYPMQTFSKERIVDFADIPVFLEGCNEETFRQMEMLAQSVSHQVMRLSTEDRKFLHLAAVFACNFANHCYELSAEILERHGIPFDVMLPLIDETAAKVHHLSPKEAQTGPAVRFDENVIRAHTTLLKDQPTVQQIYQTMSHSIHQTALPNEELVYSPNSNIR